MNGQQRETETPALVRTGRRLLGISVAALVAGATIVSSFPALRARGLDWLTLSILVPIWIIGIAGIVVLLIAWVKYPAFETQLDMERLELAGRADGQVFSRFTKSLAVFAVVLFWLASFAFWRESNEVLPIWEKALLSYCITCYCGMIVYLATAYARDRHHATSTYLNHLSPAIAIILVPLTWPLLIILNTRVVRREADLLQSVDHDALMDDVL